MRFMVIVKADQDSEAEVLPDKEELADIEKFKDSLARAGVLLAAEDLHPGSKGFRVGFTGSGASVAEGPFTTRELITGFLLLQVKSVEEAIEWAKRCPVRAGGQIEIRPIYEAADLYFGSPAPPRADEGN